MKRILLWCVYVLFALLAVIGMIGAVYLYPTHAAHGTSAAYFTMILFPTVNLLLGLTGILFRYWWVLEGAAWIGLLVYMIPFINIDLFLFGCMLLYLVLGMSAGFAGGALRR
ncbi:MAG: hypothetical protein IJX14_02775 [Clostridia bacterium]|nr:hypothetical protein [Clostridia bacterium]